MESDLYDSEGRTLVKIGDRRQFPNEADARGGPPAVLGAISRSRVVVARLAERVAPRTALLDGAPQSQISRIERGAISPTATTLAKIAAVLDAEIRLVERQSA